MVTNGDDAGTQPTTGGRPGRRPTLIVAGVALVLAVPGAQILVAFLWSNGLINPDPNGPAVQGLQAMSTAQPVLAPLGLVLIGIGGGLARPVWWIAMFALTFVPLVILWFLGAAWLGGLAGEPF